MKQEYDIAFSLGSTCAVSQALRESGCQFSSFPLDWVATPGVVEAAQMVADGFDRWLEAEDLELWDVRHGAGFCTRIYRNARTGCGFSHEFSDFERFAVSYPKVKAMYDRRIDRFLKEMSAAKRILTVYNELSIRGAAADDALLRALSILQKRYPQAEVDLVYFWAEPGAATCHERRVANHVLSIGVDYRKYDDGEITHFVDRRPFVQWLAQHASVPDRRTAEEKQAFVRQLKNTDLWRWGYGQSRFRRWYNHQAYKFYRHLESVLQRRGMVQKEGPLWFVEK